MTNRIWTNPPIVYEVTSPSAHMTKRITNIVQSMLQLLSHREPNLSVLLSTRCLAPFCVARLLCCCRRRPTRAAAMTHELFALFDDCFAALAQLVALLT